jgi:hypothetical protein
MSENTHDPDLQAAEAAANAAAAEYAPPLDALLDSPLGAPRTGARDYAALGIGPEHVPDLIRMAADARLSQAPSTHPAVYAPIHAWRALGQLRAVEAVAPLLAVVAAEPDDDWVGEEIPGVLGSIGAPALHPLRAFVADDSVATWSRVTGLSALKEVAARTPELQDEVVAAFRSLLRHAEENDSALNGFSIGYLADLGATEAADEIRAAFEAGRVDEMICGDWEEVQMELGLLEERITPRRSPLAEITARAPTGRPAAPSPLRPAATGGGARAQAEAQKAARKRKEARKSRRKNRKR